MSRAHIQPHRAVIAHAAAVSAAAVLALAQNLSAQVPAQHPSETGGLPLSTLQQTVKHYDFEFPDAPPDALPYPFYRHVAPSAGFPPFGTMRMARDQQGGAFSGRCSLEFALAGGSMSARIPTSHVQVLPLADYVVTVHVKTQGLQHARARLVAWLHDVNGKIIPASVTHSRLCNTSGTWEPISVEIRGEFREAADLVIELQVVQPAQYTRPDHFTPRFEDRTGKVWFDEVLVEHLPRLTLSMSNAGLVRQPATAELRLDVSEFSGSAMTARLQVADINGSSVYDSTFPAPRGRQSVNFRIPTPQCGWYRAALHVTSESGLTRRRFIDFIVLPQKTRSAAAADSRFAAILPDPTADAVNEILALVEHSRCGRVAIPAWSANALTPLDHPAAAARKQLIEQLLRRHVEVILAMNHVPDELANSLSLQPSQVMEMLAKDSKLWRPLVDDLLVTFGMQVRRWLIAPGQHDFFLLDAPWQSDSHSSASNQVLANAASLMSDFVPDPLFYTNLFIEQPPAIIGNENEQSHASHVNVNGGSHYVEVPCAIQPSAVMEHLQPFAQANADTLALLKLLSEDQFSPRQRMIDGSLRVLHAWRSGVRTLAIDAPWTTYTDARDRAAHCMPSPMLAAWSTLVQQLSGRSFVTRLSLGGPDADITAWLLQGTDSRDTAIVAWCDRASDHHSVSLHSQLATGPVHITDLMGNTHTVHAREDIHHVELTDMPVFIEGVNLELVQFRASFAIDPPFVPAVARIHERHITLRNPWDLTISGSVRLTSNEPWQLTPSVQEFIIKPRSEVRLPVSIIVQRSMLAGTKTVRADVQLNADLAYALAIDAEIEVGLEDIDLATTWTFVANQHTGQDDLVLTHSVTNRGERAVNVDVYMLAPGLSQTRRTIAGLGPGETAVRVFRVPNGAALLDGKQVRVGVAERDGFTRLNRMLTISRNRS